ncbi:peptide ABC transporter substrate-binding protein [Devosia yakushimensis]|uniref:Peptide ABC transporter substrate-binding protein n=1 Tax=Devosia yakushimensis TaxID=470028 RepID=A0ABQ5UFW5_9HYPH|nr:ABC transporter substrate-binding protein [Devosia yakushimensis]GLQ09461.1 peptide ABC transporter substrate-binding protein [Devosia yakushimensis]
MSSLWTPSRRHFLGLSAAALGAGLLARPALAQSPQHGGTLSVVAASEPPTMTGIAHTGVTFTSPKSTEGLLTFDFDLNPKPLLATQWSISPDGLAYTFTLRQGVKFHDGTPFTAADVAYSISTIKEVHPRGRVTFANLTGIETPDEHTVVLKLSKPAPYLLPALSASETPIVPRHLYEGTAADANPVNNAPIGTGPWVFKEWVRGSHIVWDRNPDYWDQPRPYADQLILRIIPDGSARAAAIETGEINLAPQSPVPLSELARFSTLPNIGVEQRGYSYFNNISRIEFNFDRPYFADVRVRKAFAHLIDRNVIHQTALYGYGTPIPGPISASLTKYYVPDLPTYPIDLAKAEALLDEAGYPRGTDGIRLRLTHDPHPSAEYYKRGGEYIRQALAAAGIEVSLRTQDFATYIKRVYTDRDFDFTFHGMSNLFDPTVGVQRLYWSKNFKPGIPFTNGSHYASDKVDALLEAAAVEVDAARRLELFTAFQRQVVEDVPDIGVVSGVELTLYDKRVADHTIGAEGLNDGLAYAHFTA